MIKITKLAILGVMISLGLNTNAQTPESKSEIEQITETLMNYIDGTANGDLDKLSRAFHPDFNLYSVTEEDNVRVWEGKDYVGRIKEGEKSNRIGRIISIDFENNAASAKVEILIPNWRLFTDYFLLLKYQETWKIIQKSYTWKAVAKVDSDSKEVENSNKATGDIATFLTFQKADAEQAMDFYIGLFDNSKIVDLKRWGKSGPGKEGTVMHATFKLNGKLYMCSDSPAIHDWGFTPGVSNFVQCTDENEIEHLFIKLSENGKVLMPLNNYGFSQKFGFVEDRFGVSWQLNLE